MEYMLNRRNDAVEDNGGHYVNGQHADILITDAGSSFYYAFCAVFGATAIGLIATAHTRPPANRILFYLTAAINFTSCLAYYAMGSNLGWTPIDVEFQRSASIVAGVNRQIFYARYIEW